MPDIGGMELLVIGIVALIVVGPKDLPGMFKKLGQMVARVRGMAKEFSNAMNAAADGTGMTEMNRDLRAAAKFTNPKSMAKDLMGDVMDDIDPSKYEEGSETRIIAEKNVKARAEAKRLAVELRAKRAERDAKAAELSGEPSEDAPADPGPADVEAAEPAPKAKAKAKPKAKAKAAPKAKAKPKAKKKAAEAPEATAEASEPQAENT